MVVAELLEHGAPLPLILLCLLVGFNPRLSHTQDSINILRDEWTSKGLRRGLVWQGSLFRI